MRMTHLQTVFAVFNQDPKFYEIASWATAGLLLFGFAVAYLPRKDAADSQALALAAAACFTLMPVYHRLYDAKLLLLSVPAIVLLWNRNRLLGALALLLSMPVLFSLSFQALQLIGASAIQDLPKWQILLIGRQAPLGVAALTMLYTLSFFGAAARKQSDSQDGLEPVSRSIGTKGF
jgi:hypothetical protein